MEIPEVTSVKVLRPYVLEVSFVDGKRRCIDLKDTLWGEMFEPLRDPKVFSEVFVDPVWHTVAWPNGADLAPEYLYEAPEAAAAD
ncbi:MAG TPA: DUF2442 domain-containing protein [Dehalococcoidia bacterium]|nr:DUF2442 domain-containing protein [Dehalococcoidia bacterium]